jgi:hypothetical protein
MHALLALARPADDQPSRTIPVSARTTVMAHTLTPRRSYWVGCLMQMAIASLACLIFIPAHRSKYNTLPQPLAQAKTFLDPMNDINLN